MMSSYMSTVTDPGVLPAMLMMVIYTSLVCLPSRI